MSEALMQVTLSIGAGPGHIVRRNGSVLFGPDGIGDALLTRFREATSDAEAVAEAKRFLIESSFVAAPIVVINWGTTDCDVLIFGETELMTSVVAAPMVSGAGSTTWIERHLGSLELGSANHVELWVGAEVNEHSDLERGSIGAGGFRLVLTLPVADEDQALATPAPTESEISPAAEPVPPQPEVAPAEPAVPEPAVEPVVPEPEPVAPEPVAVDPVVAAHASNPFEIPDEPPAMASPQHDPFGDTSDGNDHQVVQERPAAGGVLVEAAVCSQGHPNAPRSIACLSCGEDLPLDSSLRLVDQPAIGNLEFLSGQIVAVEGTVVIGRRPAAADGEITPVIVDQPEVSRSHASVAVDGWTVLLTDLGSVNGTYVSTPADASPHRLDANVPHLLEAGTVVHLGGSETAFTYVVVPGEASS